MFKKIVLTFLLFISLTILGCNSKVDKPSSTFLLSESKLKFEDNKMQLSVKAKNNSSDISKGYVCVRLYDKDNSELEQFTGQEVSLNGDKEGNYSGEKQIENYVFEKIINAKIYIGKFGCTNTESESLSNIEIVDIKNIPSKIVEKTLVNQSDNIFYSENFKKIEKAGFCFGAYVGAKNKFQVTVEKISEISKNNLLAIAKDAEAAKIFNYEINKDNCIANSKSRSFDELDTCIDRDISNKQAATFFKAIVRGQNYLQEKVEIYVDAEIKTNSICLDLNQ
jgi:hypothetical protein